MESNLKRRIQKYVATIAISLLLLSPYVFLVIAPEGVVLHAKVALVCALIGSAFVLPVPLNKKRYYMPFGALLSALAFYGWLNHELFKNYT